MAASEIVRPFPGALEAMLTRASAVTLKSPGPTPDDLRAILTAATRAPDHGKLQPWRFIVVEGSARDRFGDVMAQTFRARHPDASDADVARERDKVFRAPTIVTAGAKIVEHAKIPRFEQEVAVAAAVENLVLAAHALGYGTMWKTGAPAYDDAVKAFFGLEPHDAILGFIYLGTIDVAPKALRPTNYEEVVRWL
jgi:nitroreductase